MRPLVERQRALVRAVLHGDEAVAGDVQTSSESLPPSARVGIYRDSVRGVLSRALRLSFPVCLRVVGPDWFDAMCVRYIDAHPPAHADLDRYGDRLADFLRGFPPARELGYLADLAALEWAVHRARCEARDAGPFDAAALADVPPQAQAGLRLRLIAGLSVIAVAGAIDQLWFAHGPEVAEPGDVELGEDQIQLAVWPDAGGIGMRRISEPEAQAVAMIAAGCALGELVDAGDEIAASLPQLLRHGWIAGIDPA